MIFKSIICLFKGHDVNPDESITKMTLKSSKNWLCKCHRCGLYVMHDGDISGKSVVMGRKSAEQIAKEFNEITAFWRDI